jgi:hypothetical protein
MLSSSVTLMPARTGINSMEAPRDGGHFTRWSGHAHG